MLEKHLKKIREKKKISLEELSQCCNLPSSYLKEVEDGKKELSPKALDRLLSNLELDEDLENFCASTNGLGDKIRALREEKGLTLEEMGSSLGLSFTYLSEIERGQRIPSVQALQKISSFFNLPITLFINTDSKLISTGKKIKLNRQNKGLTQKQLAVAANVSPGLIAQLEAGKVQPSLKTVERLADALGVSVCHLILEQEDVEGIMGGINSELREILYEPQVQMLIGHICTMKKEEIRLVLNFIQMLKNPVV